MARPVASPVAAYQTPVAGSVELQNVFEYRRNWGRWGPDDQMGAVNLITPARRTAAAALVNSGRTVSLSRGFEPSQHFIRITERPEFSTASDYYGSLYHGPGVTHVDALSHMWDRHGMWNGRDAAKEIDTNGARFADIAAFGDGLITRGVLLNVPRYRRTAYVTNGRPVEGAELDAIARAQGVLIEPGDALLVYSGREAFVRDTNRYDATGARPGLHVSCARFIRDRDVAVLGWDMTDVRPGVPLHGVLYSYGVVLLDNALLEPWHRFVQTRGVMNSCSWLCR